MISEQGSSRRRTLTIRPQRLEAAVVRPADLAPTPFGIWWVLRDAGFRPAVAPVRALRQQAREGFQVTKAPRPGAVRVRWMPEPGQPASPAGTGAWLARYAEAIQAAGWHAEIGTHELTVTAAQAP